MIPYSYHSELKIQNYLRRTGKDKEQGQGSGVGPQQHLDMIDKTLKDASNKVLKGILVVKKTPPYTGENKKGMVKTKGKRDAEYNYLRNVK
jgi:hypothetical protein